MEGPRSRRRGTRLFEWSPVFAGQWPYCERPLVPRVMAPEPAVANPRDTSGGGRDRPRADLRPARLFTAPDVRGRGVARALIEAVTGWARARDCGRVYWNTHESNSTARHGACTTGWPRTAASSGTRSSCRVSVRPAGPA
ncbi:GNAT family N-acetyltransferase [Streptosporangium subroseum]|uniref:GNAT family N-acetyltransferase n=1 Tax=Streptosporangium subroseum TaxID=106412 RepID=UPI00343ACA66